jgi:hypothetical protein
MLTMQSFVAVVAVGLLTNADAANHKVAPLGASASTRLPALHPNPVLGPANTTVWAVPAVAATPAAMIEFASDEATLISAVTPVIMSLLQTSVTVKGPCVNSGTVVPGAAVPLEVVTLSFARAVPMNPLGARPPTVAAFVAFPLFPGAPRWRTVGAA